MSWTDLIPFMGTLMRLRGVSTAARQMALGSFIPHALLTLTNDGDDTAPLGADLVSNGTFDTDLSDWTIQGGGADWIWNAGGKAEHDLATVNTLYQGISVTNETIYHVEFTTSDRTAGSVVLTFGTYVGSYAASGNATYRQSFEATATEVANLTFTPTADYDGMIDDVTVKAITGGGTPVLLVENSDGSDAIEVRSGGIDLDNTFIGMHAGYFNTTGAYSTFIGQTAGYSNTTGAYNTFIGQAAGRFNTTGDSNTFIGMHTGYSNTTGTYNTFIGRYAGYSNTTGAYNIFIGMRTGYSNTTGARNTFIGIYTGYSNTEGSYNTFIGRDTGYSNTEGSYNTFIGQAAGYSNTTGTNNICIGYNIDMPAVDSTQCLNIGALIFGTGLDGVDTGISNGSVGIRLTNPGVCGGTAPTNGVGVLHLANAATNPIGTLTGGGALFYATGGEMRVVDAGGIDTLLSPHDENGEWVYLSRNTQTGKTTRIRMERFIRRMEALTGEAFIEEG